MAKWGAAALVVLAVAGELFARFWLGLGDPPLHVLDPEIEYFYRPDSRYRRYGNDFVTNRFGMRGPGFPGHKSRADELRVLVLGDSVCAGGARVDQRDLATEHLRETLASRTGRPVVVANAATGSWGTPNMLAYTRRFGFFDADVAVIVLNSGDWGDVPGVEYVGSQFPTRRPWLALQEIAERALPRALARAGVIDPPMPPAAGVPEADRRSASEAALRDLVADARTAGCKVVVVQHLTRKELGGREGEGYRALGGLADELGVPRSSDGPRFAGGAAGPGENFLPGDDVHPSAAGHRLLAEVMAEAVTDALSDAPGPDR